MKRLLMAAALLPLAWSASAQMKEGKVIYERTMQLPLRGAMGNGPDAPPPPPPMTNTFELLFGNNQSLWQFLPNPAEEGDGTVSPAPGMFVRVMGLRDAVFYDFAAGRRVDAREVMDRSYLVSDSIRKLQWKMTEETKPILSYTARKAVARQINSRTAMTMENGEMKRQAITDTTEVVAWFTTDIPVPAGPEFGGQLPGLILELHTGNGRQVYRAVEVSPKVNMKELKEPREGKKVTAAQFTAEREKLMEEMRQNMPAGRQRITIN